MNLIYLQGTILLRMKAVLRLPEDKTPECLTKEGYQKAAAYCRDSESCIQTPEARFDSLCAVYLRCAQGHEKALENFYRDEYFVRGNDRNDQQATDMIMLAYRTKGLLNGVYARMEGVAAQDSSLTQAFASYGRAQEIMDQNLAAAFRVYSTKGAVYQAPSLPLPRVSGFFYNMIRRWKGAAPV